MCDWLVYQIVALHCLIGDKNGVGLVNYWIDNFCSLAMTNVRLETFVQIVQDDCCVYANL